MKMLICERCGKEFTPKHKNSTAKYCSQACRNESVRLNNRREAECYTCGDTFISFAAINLKTYCSEDCRPEVSEAYNRNRYQIYARDNFSCVYCGRHSTEDEVKLSLDHLIPQFNRGTDTADNLLTCCIECNSAKGNRTLSEDNFKVFTEYLTKANKRAEIPGKTVVKGAWSGQKLT